MSPCVRSRTPNGSACRPWYAPAASAWTRANARSRCWPWRRERRAGSVARGSRPPGRLCAWLHHGYTVSRLIQRCNARGLAALSIAPGRGRTPPSAAAERQQILDVLPQTPEREQEQDQEQEQEQDQRATWSLTLLQRRLRASGLPQVSRDTLHQTLRQAGYTWQRTRAWCATGTARRQRKAGMVPVVDPEAEPNRG
jgi:transposase